MRLKALAAVACVIASLALAPAPAQATTARPADCGYGFYYSYSINSSYIQANAYNACGNGGTAYMVIERLTNGYFAFVAASSSGVVSYTCNGTTPNTYHIGPIFTPGVSGYTWYQFTDNCG